MRPVQQKQKINSKSFELAHEDEGNNTVLSSFRPEVVEVINEEEEKVPN
tara:strand:- start:91 stop:237 length:147 start_codon:yes stop_codon:yes gene_type:complete